MMEKKEYIFANDVGDATMIVYDVFPGVQLVYHSIHMNQLFLGSPGGGKLIEIHHCNEGRMEQEFEDEYFYLTPGDLSVAIRTQMGNDYIFPLQHYHGITIGINMDVVSPAFWRLLEEMQIHPMEIAQGLCCDKNCFIVRSGKYIEHVFSELYSVPENIKEGYFKVKILELLLALSGKDLQENKLANHVISKSQQQLANQVVAYLSRHMSQHITIDELAKEFNVSATHLKNIFKEVYGMPVFSYMRTQKMQAAAQSLVHTEYSITDIAYEYGYGNLSKFSAAFQKVMGCTPSAYRKQYQNTMLSNK